jgi:signal transduction protein with GAF and PtsI domain
MTTKRETKHTSTKVRGEKDHPNKDFKTLMEAQSRAAEKARILEKALHLFSAPERVVENVGALLDLAMEVIPCEAGSILLLSDKDEMLHFIAARGPVADKLKDFTVKIGEGLAGGCVADKRSFPVSDVEREPRFSRKISEALGFATKSLLAVPVIFRGRAIGAIELVNRKKTTIFLPHEVELVERLARACGALVHVGGLVKASQ